MTPLVYLYGGALIAGGVAGFASKGSIPSLVAGSLSGLLVLYLESQGTRSSSGWQAGMSGAVVRLFMHG